MLSSSSANCSFDVGSHRFDLSSWADRTIVAHQTQQGGGTYNVSLCRNLRELCHDSLTGAPAPPGAVFSMFAKEPPRTCWDVLAPWTDLQRVTPPDDAQQLPGLTFHYSHPFDAHLGCSTVTVAVSVMCNRTLPPSADPTASGEQTPGDCDWHIAVQTAHTSVCEPSAIAEPAPSTLGGSVARPAWVHAWRRCRLGSGLGLGSVLGAASVLWARTPALLALQSRQTADELSRDYIFHEGDEAVDDSTTHEEALTKARLGHQADGPLTQDETPEQKCPQPAPPPREDIERAGLVGHAMELRANHEQTDRDAGHAKACRPRRQLRNAKEQI